MTWPSTLRLAAVDCGRHDVHAGRADEIADEGMRGLLEQFGRRAALHHAAVMHDHHRVGEGQRLGLVMRHIDHRQIELAVQRLQFGAKLPLQFGIDHRQRLVEQDRGDVGADQAAAERNLLLGVRREPRRLAVEIGREVEQPRDVGDALVDLRLRHAAVFQRKCQILPDRHGVVDHRKLEHLGDVALLCRQRRDIDAVEQDLSTRRRDDAGDQVEQRGLAAAGGAEQRIGAALPPGHGHRLQRKAFHRRMFAAVGLREIDEVNAGHAASPSCRTG